MTATLEEIHRDPAILDRAILRCEPLDIMSNGAITATLVPNGVQSVDEAQSVMRARFASPDWSFSMGEPMSREERNSRG